MPDSIGVVIPVFNGASYLKEALDSIFAQEYAPQEVIVVDDGSTDESLAISTQYSQIHCISQENRGVAIARNIGIQASQTDLIAFLDQDDIWAPEKFHLQISYLEEHLGAGYVVTQQLFFLDKGFKRPAWLKPELLEGPQPGLTPSTLLVRRSVFDQIGDFDPKYPMASDVDWFFRAKDAGTKMGSISKPLVYKRVHADNQSNLARSLHAEYIRIARDSLSRRPGRKNSKS